jgi:hypothetical protein
MSMSGVVSPPLAITLTTFDTALDPLPHRGLHLRRGRDLAAHVPAMPAGCATRLG